MASWSNISTWCFCREMPRFSALMQQVDQFGIKDHICNWMMHLFIDCITGNLMCTLYIISMHRWINSAKLICKKRISPPWKADRWIDSSIVTLRTLQHFVALATVRVEKQGTGAQPLCPMSKQGFALCTEIVFLRSYRIDPCTTK